ncbi:iron-containing alcohol dehydrogenase [Clostridium estertheticum]|uniref:iron-containing alcohol dehydrogenase n=1 Tax=Clostridium estertheticum TaxID=238834 RepID=UPI001C0C60F1|nr:iron-containing alcohol dehydrogenase [Clostridium estertheticum]MBU3074830.1 iron-containing alcohol dehydrogenase [Clostridium estertheticum]MBU3165045.1 iron-containing alcohol dehydrogenase [Clostridium estertheticum]
MDFNMYVPTRFIFGCGRLNELHDQELPGKKAMVVISNGKSTKENGYIDRTIEELTIAGVESVVFDKVQTNPLKSTVMAGAKTARDNGCDFIVALGGGSVIDASKVMAAMTTNDGYIWDYISGGTGKGKAIANAPLAVICITTTAGTGSEADQWGVITNDETNEKIGFGGDDRLFPLISIIDPELMKTVPSKLTAYQGFDALFHSTESYISKYASLMSDMYALTAIENAAKYLTRAVKDGSDMEAREHMAFANTLSGIVMTVSVTTAEHSIEHAMSAYHQELPHGAGLIMISKAFYEFFIDKHACDERFMAMAKAMGINEANKPEDFITALVDLQKACGVDELKMSDYGISPDEFDKIATNARETNGFLFTANPCEMTHKDVVDVLRNSYR